MDKAIDTVLGKNTTEYRQNYAPDYLVAIDRQDNRTGLGIKPDMLPFTGADVWHDYEASFLYRGYPINGILKIVIPAWSPKTVESKSLKLYLFSYVMENLSAPSRQAAITMYESRIRSDLTALVGAPVYVCLHKVGFEELGFGLDNPETYLPATPKIKSLESSISWADVKPAVYQEDPNLLSPSINRGEPLFITCSSLKSNCKVTHQPDWGQLYIYMTGKTPSLESLYRYIVSFRGENHFHEEIVECIFQRLLEAFQPEKLDVMAFYTRRGGIDICPMRSTRDNNVFSKFLDPNTAGYRAVRS